MEINKVSSYLGFAAKSRKLVIGTDAILKGHVFVVLVSEVLSENARQKIKNHIEKSNAKLIILPQEVYKEVMSICVKQSTLAVGVSDENLAYAIIKVIQMN